jgi:FMN phosphatase YigB (HAD superfamily)
VTNIREIMLDFYGTLVHEDDIIIPLICEEVHRGVPVTATTDASGPTATGIGRFWWDLFRARFQVSFDDTFVDQRTLGLDTLNDSAAAFGSTCDSPAIIDKQFAHWLAPPIFPDAVPFLAQVRSLRMPICVVSNIDRGDIEAAIAFHGLQFDGLVTSEDARAYKPRP